MYRRLFNNPLGKLRNKKLRYDGVHSAYLLHGLGLGSGPYTGHRQTDVDGGPDTLVEQLSLQEDLAVSDGNHVGGNVSGHVTGLGLDDGQGGQGATAHLVGPGDKIRVGQILVKTDIVAYGPSTDISLRERSSAYF